MIYLLKSFDFSEQKILIYLIVVVLIVSLPFFEPRVQEVEAEFVIKERPESFQEQLIIIQGNSLLPVVDPVNPKPPAAQKIWVVATAYSSTPWETDSDPHITAAGTLVRNGIVANNYFPIGTKIRIPELFGDRIFVVEDRMSWKKGNYQIDIWFPSYWEALNFGVKRTYIEILKN